MTNVSLDTYAAGDLAKVLEQYPPDAAVVIEWGADTHLLDHVCEGPDGQVRIAGNQGAIA